MAGKLIIFSAPSGSGKSTIINYLLKQDLHLRFSISATSRAPRGTEKNGVEYYFLTPEEFRSRIANGDFLEYEEVYTDKYYGTLKSEVERILNEGDNVIFDVDVVGGCNIKKFYGDRALSVFIQPPCIDDLRKRLEGRGTDSPEVIESRIAKADERRVGTNQGTGTKRIIIRLTRMAGKLIIFSAPSGSGKSTIINYLLKQDLHLRFSISATSRAPRGTEKNGVEYYFLTPEEFRSRIANGDFLEYEEVYTDKYYGTLKSEVERILNEGDNVIFDVDVVGGCNIKKFYGDRALSVFIQPPCIDDLRKRLEGRGTDSPEVIESRIAKAEYELGFTGQFDKVVVNDDLETAQKDALKIIREFLNK